MQARYTDNLTKRVVNQIRVPPYKICYVLLRALSVD